MSVTTFCLFVVVFCLFVLSEYFTVQHLVMSMA